MVEVVYMEGRRNGLRACATAFLGTVPRLAGCFSDVARAIFPLEFSLILLKDFKRINRVELI